ncbi:MAG: helix-hairpin-helix domain-containing protein [Deltaproteobacteria bacterium]|nr:helix-hairpin-helix domain-containing protein [Deltaproteobacteria bacterium]
MFKPLISSLTFAALVAAPAAWAAEGPTPATAGHKVAAQAAAANPAMTTVHLNTATAVELEKLPGVGPILAQRIVQYRTEHGPFTRVDQLDQVKGVGEQLLQQVQANLDL